MYEWASTVEFSLQTNAVAIVCLTPRRSGVHFRSMDDPDSVPRYGCVGPPLPGGFRKEVLIPRRVEARAGYRASQ
jgi:hypothetical protein